MLMKLKLQKIFSHAVFYTHTNCMLDKPVPGLVT